MLFLKCYSTAELLKVQLNSHVNLFHLCPVRCVFCTLYTVWLMEEGIVLMGTPFSKAMTIIIVIIIIIICYYYYYHTDNQITNAVHNVIVPISLLRLHIYVPFNSKTHRRTPTQPLPDDRDQFSSHPLVVFLLSRFCPNSVQNREVGSGLQCIYYNAVYDA